MPAYKKDCRGFTLIEIVVALFLLTTAFMGLISMTAMAVNGNSFSRMSTTAAALASDKMESIKALPFNHADLAAGAHADAGNPIRGLYTRLWNVTDYRDATDTQVRYKTVTLNVTWNGKSRSHSISISTIKTNSN